ncbi:hypothetical protein HHK36_030000 [Tetracentron sinense]|uniref:DUF4228 domain-containing protein n=1 Tax=Tetracentron sinense TaxID=13715 RepID=A0A834YAM6_TETSI|nr:hypothetical protein HHK36_030000 [Tetracentron sinense]
MGNYISCTLSITTSKHSRFAKVIFPSGEIRQVDEPIKAAELMFEIPNFFLVNSGSLQMGRRFSALNADEDLEMGNVYIMFPMKRLTSVITAADMGLLFLSANSAAKRICGGKERESGGDTRVTPFSPAANSGDDEMPRLNLDDIEDLLVPEFKHRLSMCKRVLDGAHPTGPNSKMAIRQAPSL